MPPRRPKRPEAKENAEPGSPRRDIVLQPECLEDMQYWIATEWRTARRILDLMAEVMRTPFEGTGRPEHLKHLGANVWSRRINQTDRLVYLVGDERIDFLQARYHYGRE
ncbi:MAG: Txe/YoeB family addiction module toxin [Chloroflexota bacterium]|nr:Txe/YoeB family addiction module toxin [Chloroflexota bacterium]